MHLRTSFFLIAFFISAKLFAQENLSSVSGIIVDTSAQPLNNATVLLLKKEDSAVIKSAITNKEGLFLISLVKIGDYLLLVSHTSFSKYYMSITVTPQPIVTGKIELATLSKQLAEVTVVSKKPFIEVQDDKTIINVESSIVSTGGTAMDVLERSPGIATNQDGAISLRGREGVIIMIDGRPSPLGAADISTMLRNMPANSIDKIEIITNASARYDAAGNAGIINIRLKKDQKLGLNGSYTIGYGQGIYAKPYTGVTFNYRNNKVNLFGNYNYAWRKNFRDLVFEREFYSNLGVLENNSRQETFTTFVPENHSARIGIDYFASPKTVIGIMGDLTFNKTLITGESVNKVEDAIIVPLFIVNSAEATKDKRHNYNINTNIKHNFSANQELIADVDYYSFSNKNNAQYFITQKQGIAPAGFPVEPFSSIQNRSFTVLSFKADYKQTLKNKAVFETGLKTSTVDTDNEIVFFLYPLGMAQIDSLRSNEFLYKETIHAAYINYRQTIKKWTFQGGLRTENTIGNGVQKTTAEKVSRNYTQLFPSATITLQTNKTDKLIFSYSRRITRPPFRDLNPFRSYTDPFAYNSGNPLLLPTLTHSIDVTYNYAGKFITNVNYSNSKNFMATLFTRDLNSKIQEEKPFNFEKRYSISLNLTLPLRITQWWQTNTSASFFRTVFGGSFLGNELNNTVTGFIGNSVNTITLPKNYTVELSGNYRSKVPWGANVLKGVGSISVGASKNILQSKGSIRLNISDIFYMQNLTMDANNQNPVVRLIRLDDTRVATLNFTYRFGKKTITQNRNRNTGSEDERNRIN